MHLLKYLLLPFAWLYNLITRLRNYLYDIGHKKSFQFDTIVISVGNLNVGGSGKTPMVEYLIRLLSSQYKVASLSRGYGRKTKGFRIAKDDDTALTLGDEPYQIFRKFKERIVVAVGEDRALAIPTILNECPEVQVILMDDAFQHRAVVPQFSILVTDYNKPFYKDFLMPFGRLREARDGAARADVVVMTKCADLNSDTENLIRQKLENQAGSKPVFFSRLKYNSPLGIDHAQSISNDIVLVSALANNSSFAHAMAKDFKVHHHVRFPDHHVYSISDIIAIHQKAEDCKADSILTTEKDMVKLIVPALVNEVSKKKWFYVPIEANFIKNGAEFDIMIKELIEENLAKPAASIEKPEALS
jgi:tetraacyldisaccharide 4'-kinase